jgi:NADPH:quinone reductase-like Zn-dependent oxidoreductase
MKAIVWTKYGSLDGLQLKEVEKPAPKDNEVLIRIHATTVTAGDTEIRGFKLPIYLSLPIRIYAGIRKPERIKILGMELAGEIEAIGKDVKRFKEGDQVFGLTGFGFGAYAEYICLPEEPVGLGGLVAKKPANMSYEEAAVVPVGGLEALHFLRQANIKPEQKILINGAGGSIGTFGIQLSKNYGAEVTAVDSTGKLDMMRSIGADYVIDYTQEDFTKRGETYDVIFDVVGKSPYSRSIRSLNPNGYYLIANPRPLKMIRGMWTSQRSSIKVITETSSPMTKDLLYLKELIEAGKLRSVIDRRYPLEQIPEAYRYVETGQKKGGLAIIVRPDNKTL